ncbi:hypothetical protein JY651_27705 [Pyxidicoccus parkwayensis]|uniref:Ricin B lectin domain-containing protein n=1 Tax=Pyxidicoccus parkwayensis TaxID=2813578 RepID=A0ABX7NSJ8_9BACT|nr:RICIN domain-containing protein [Pyxidicoccus parkwaysis]QSQ19133.1 hypothetical protein JY651_27705 [Pyxidicoccus parkwaysis]
MPQYFHIASATNPSYVVGAAGSTSGSAVQLVQRQSGIQAQSQLWRLTASGYLVNGYDSSLVLAVGSAGVEVVTQGSSGGTQLWQLNAGEASGQPRAGTLQNTASNQLLTITSYANGASLVMLDGTAPAQSDALWTMDPFPVPFGQPTALSSALNAGYFHLAAAGAPSTLLLNVSGGSSAPGTQVIVWTPQGSGSINDLWRLTPSGYIVSALSPELVLGLGTYANGVQPVVTCEVKVGDDTQLWTLGSGSAYGMPDASTIINKATNQALAVQNGDFTAGANVVTIPLSGDTPAAALWTANLSSTQPSAVEGQTAVTSGPTTSPPVPLVANIQGNSASGGAAVILWPLQSVPPGLQPPFSGVNWPNNNIWRYSIDGYITSDLMPDFVLTAMPDNSVVMYPKQTITAPAQQWNISASAVKWSGMPLQVLKIANVQYGGLLTMPDNALDTSIPLVLAQEGSTASAYQQAWYNTNGYPLDVIVGQMPLGFPTSSASQAISAYNYISTTIKPTVTSAQGIRGEYTNTTDVPEWLANLPTLPPPSGISPDVWTQVSQQIQTELTYASAIQSLSNSASNFYSALETNVLASLNSIAEGITSLSTQSSGNASAVIEGVALSFVQLVPDVGGCIAGLVQTGLNAAASYGQSGPLGKIDAEVGQLMTNVSTLFTNVTTATQDQMTAALGDWGQMRAIGPLTALMPGHPDSLAWTVDTESNLENSAMPGVYLAVGQMLLPSVYYIWQAFQQSLLDSVNASISIATSSTPPSGCYMSVVTQASDKTYYGAYDLYVVASSSWSYPSSTVMSNYVWNLGVTEQAFYMGSPSWPFPTRVTSILGEDSKSDGYTESVPWNQTMLARIYNCTPNALTVKLTPNHDCPVSWGNMSQALPAYSMVEFAASAGHHGDTSVNVAVTDSNGTQVMAFEVLGGSTTSVPWNSGANGYFLTASCINAGSGKPPGNWGPPGIANVSLGQNT